MNEKQCPVRKIHLLCKIEHNLQNSLPLPWGSAQWKQVAGAEAKGVPLSRLSTLFSGQIQMGLE